MKTLGSMLFASFLAVSTSAFAQGHEHHGGAAAAPAPEAEAQVNSPAVAEIDPAAKDKGSCEKCKRKGMGGGHQGHGDGGIGGGMGGGHEGHGGGGMGGGHKGHGDGGMGGCKCKKGGMGGGHEGHGGGDCPKAAALEDRIDELEKRLDLLQMLLMRYR
jgi:hypothetical protein